MAVDVVFRKLVTCALVVSLALLHRGSCASLSNIGGSGGGGGGGNSESTVLGSASSSKLVTPTLGSLYRSTRDEYGRNGREERCVNCGGGGGAYGDRDMRTYGGRPGGIYGYYSGQGSIYDDKNWYYRPEAYDGGAGYRGREGYYGRPSYMNMMMGHDDRYMSQMSPVNRYDDRYYPMSMRGYYDNRGGVAGDHRMGAGNYPVGADMGMRTGGYGYRGNGYDNLDPLYEQYMMAARGGTGGYNRDRYQGTSAGYGAAAGAGGYEDRYRGSYGAYDYKNFRPWDETYSTAYGSRPRPAGGLGATSYLMDRDTGDSVSASQLHSSDSDAAVGGGAGPGSSSSSSNDINNDGKPVVGENPLKSNES